MGRKGKREYIQVLRLMELFARDVVAAAITDAIRIGAIGFDAVKQLTLAKAASGTLVDIPRDSYAAEGIPEHLSADRSQPACQDKARFQRGPSRSTRR